MSKALLILFVVYLVLPFTDSKIKLLNIITKPIKTIVNTVQTTVNVVKNAFGTGPSTSSSNSMSNTAYDESQALKCSLYSSAAYCTQKCILNWNCYQSTSAPTLTHVRRYQNQALNIAHYQGYQAGSKTLYISWRGTEMRNWVQNILGAIYPARIHFFLKCLPLCKIHSGMLAGYISNMQKLQKFTKQIMNAYIQSNQEYCFQQHCQINLSPFKQKIIDIPVQQEYSNQLRSVNLFQGSFISGTVRSEVARVLQSMHRSYLAWR